MLANRAQISRRVHISLAFDSLDQPILRRLASFLIRRTSEHDVSFAVALTPTPENCPVKNKDAGAPSKEGGAITPRSVLIRARASHRSALVLMVAVAKPFNNRKTYTSHVLCSVAFPSCGVSRVEHSRLVSLRSGRNTAAKKIAGLLVDQIKSLG